jgi:CubicO group peptidase (beta-lactamase class C family)
MVHPDHWAHTGGGLHLAPRDLAKIGHLYVNEGRRNGTQVISPEWIELSTQAHLGTGRSPTESDGYQCVTRRGRG